MIFAQKISVAMSVLILASCVSTSRIADRAPASEGEGPKIDFWTEFKSTNAKSEPLSLPSGETQTSVFLKWLHVDSVTAFEALREKSPFLTLGKFKDQNGTERQAVVVSGTPDILAVLRDQKRFANEYEVRANDGSPMIFSGTTESGAVGSLLSEISKASEGAFQETVRATVARTLDEQMYVGTDREKNLYGRVELVGQMGRRIPAMMNDAIFGFQGLEFNEVTTISRALEGDLLWNFDRDRQSSQAAQVAMKNISDFTDIYLQNGVKRGTALEKAREEMIVEKVDRQASAERLRIQKIIAGIVGGVEVTQTAAAHALDEILKQGQQVRAREAALSGNDELLKAYFNEALRFQPVRSYTLRWAKHEFKLPSGHIIPAQATVIVATQSLMFDPGFLRDPRKFRTDRPASAYMHFRQSGTPQVRDVASEIEAFEIFRAFVQQPNLRRVEGPSGQIDRRTTSFAKLLNENNQLLFPESFSLEFDVPAIRGRLEIPNKEYLYEEYLKSFDRTAFKACLGSFAKDSKNEKDDVNEKSSDLTSKIGSSLRHFEIHRMNRTRENKPLFFCRMPVAFRSCIEEKKVNILRSQEIKRHEVATASCESLLSSTEKTFYRTVFFGAPLRPDMLKLDQAKRPSDPFYDFEDELVFYDRSGARQFLMNSDRFSLSPGEILFFARLNSDFRTCMSTAESKNRLSIGSRARLTEEDYQRCKIGTWNSRARRREGALTKIEKYYYEKIFLRSHLTYEQVRDREMGGSE